ncbi:Alpha/Beta hydrolase protein [Mycena polygramma]|nr:Alpha/Beta hydrolase protein [Mycena polygramma]
MAEYSHLSEPDPELAPYMAQLMAIPQTYDLKERRARFDSVFGEIAKKTYGTGLPKDTDYRLDDHQVEVKDGRILVRSLVPTSKQGSTATYPLLVWIHGGGWTNGNAELDDYLLRTICVELQISILNVDYRLAPEHPHPTGLDDCYSALKWQQAAETPELFCADLKKGFIVAGQSSGGHFASMLAHRARDDPFFEHRALTGSLLQIPVLLNHDAAPEKYIFLVALGREKSTFARYKPCLLSYEQDRNAPISPVESLVWSFSSPEDPEVSPLLYPSHKGLPPTVVQVCGLDPLRDEDLLYARLLENDGVKTKAIVWPSSGRQIIEPDFNGC